MKIQQICFLSIVAFTNILSFLSRLSRLVKSKFPLDCPGATSTVALLENRLVLSLNLVISLILKIIVVYLMTATSELVLILRAIDVE